MASTVGDHPPSAAAPTGRLLPRAFVRRPWPHTGGSEGSEGLPVPQPWPTRGVGCLGLVFPVPAAPGQVAGLEPHASGAHAELELPPAGKRRGRGRCRLSKHHRPQHSTCRGSAFPCLAGPSGDPRRGGMEGRSRDGPQGGRGGAGAGTPAGTLVASLPRGAIIPDPNIRAWALGPADLGSHPSAALA